MAAMLGGAMAAYPGGLAITITAGAISGVVSESIRGNINDGNDVLNAAVAGATVNAIGYGVGKIVGSLIDSFGSAKFEAMTRMEKKRFVNDVIYKDSQANINLNFHKFNGMSSVDRENVIAEVFRAGYWSSTLNQMYTLISGIND